MRSRLERLVGIIEAISKNRYPDVATLCRMFNVKPRTIYDDIKLLKERLGMDIVYDRGKNGYFNNTPDKRLPVFELTEEEALLLAVAMEKLAESLGDTVRGQLEIILSKIRSRLPEHVANMMVRENVRANTTVNIETGSIP